MQHIAAHAHIEAYHSGTRAACHAAHAACVAVLAPHAYLFVIGNQKQTGSEPCVCVPTAAQFSGGPAMTGDFAKRYPFFSGLKGFGRDEQAPLLPARFPTWHPASRMAT